MDIYSRISRRLHRIYIHLAIFCFNIRNSISGVPNLKASINNNKPNEGFESMNTDEKREIEIKPSDLALSQVIFSCYFIYKSDPQFGMVRGEPDIEYIAPWYRSIEKIGVTGIIIHDGIDESFIAKHQTDRILFRKYKPGKYSIFEERWIAYYMFLAQSKIKKAFFTDINDVYITKDPFEVIANDLALYVGKDNSNKVKDSGWMLAELDDLEKDANIKAPLLYQYQYVYNAGVIGGSADVLLFLMTKVINYILLTRSNTHKDMTILNLCIHEYFFPLIDQNLFNTRLTTKEDDIRAAHEYLVTGYPLNSDFKQYQLESDAYFIHK